MGVAHNGQLNAADIRNLITCIRDNVQNQWLVLHGDDEGDAETGFHLVHDDGAMTRMFGGHNAVNSVADGI